MSLSGSPDTKGAYLRALLRDRNDREALLGLAAAYLGEGDPDAACAVAAQAATRHPDSVAAYALLGSALLEKDDLVGARLAFLAAANRDAHSRKAWAGLGVVFERGGDLAAADAAWRNAFGGVEPAISTYRGAADPVRVLLLWSAVDGNVAVRPILDDHVFVWSTLFVESYPCGALLPAHDVVFNAVGNPDLRTRALACAERIARATAAPIINPPASVQRTGRVAVAERIRDIPGVVAPQIVAFAREALVGPHAAELLEQAGFTWPLLVRSPGFHTGEHFAYVADAGALPAIVTELPGDELLAIAFIDTRKPDGAVRKYRVLAIDGRLYPLHLAISDAWKVHYFRADPRPEYAEEERAFLNDMHGVLGAPAIAALEGVAATLALDYGGIDFALDDAGRVVVFEANATMAIVPPGRDDREWYRREPVRRAIDAARALITRRARG